MGVPSPCVSRRVGDPAFTLVRRSGRVGAPFVSLPHSLLGTHWRESLVPVEQRRLFQCHRFRYAAMGVLFHRWKLGFSQCRFHLASRTCGASHDISSCVSAFPHMLLSPLGFPSRSVRCPRRSYCSQPPTSLDVISQAPKRRTSTKH